MNRNWVAWRLFRHVSNDQNMLFYYHKDYILFQVSHPSTFKVSAHHHFGLDPPTRPQGHHQCHHLCLDPPPPLTGWCNMCTVPYKLQATCWGMLYKVEHDKQKRIVFTSCHNKKIYFKLDYLNIVCIVRNWWWRIRWLWLWIESLSPG